MACTDEENKAHNKLWNQEHQKAFPSCFADYNTF